VAGYIVADLLQHFETYTLYPEVKVSGFTFTGINGFEILLGVVKAIMYWQIRCGIITT
jgi:hypothetical protein